MLSKCYLLSLLCFGVIYASAQEVNSSSRLERNLKARHCDALYQIAYDRVDSNLVDGALYAQKSLSLAQDLNDTLRMIKAAKILSWPLRKMHLNDSVISLINRYLPAARRSAETVHLGGFLSRLTSIYTDRSLYDKALRYGFEALETYKSLSASEDIQMMLNNIGLIYFKLDDNKRAIKYFRAAHQIKSTNVELGTTILLNLTLSYSYENKLDSADFFFSLIKDRRPSVSISKLQSGIDFANGLIAFKKTAHRQAEMFFLKSLAASRDLQYERLVVDNVNYLFTIYKITSQNSKLQDIVSKMESTLSEKFFYNEGICLMAKNLIEFYGDGRDIHKLLKLQHNYITLKDSLYGYQYITGLMRAEGASIEQQSRAKIEAQARVMALNEKVIAWQQYLAFFLVSTLCLGAMVLQFVNRNYRLKRLANELLEQRIVERTIELERNRSELSLALEDKRIHISKLCKDAAAFLTSIMGLCMLLRREATDESLQYLNRLDLTTKEAIRYLSAVRDSNDSAV